MLIVGPRCCSASPRPTADSPFTTTAHGPLAGCPIARADDAVPGRRNFILYWSTAGSQGERKCGSTHAVHHSSRGVEGISAARFHPVNLFTGSVFADVAFASCRTRRTSSWCSALTIAQFHLRARQSRLTLGPVQIRHRRPVFPPWHHTARSAGRAELLPDVSGARCHVRHLLLCRLRAAGSLRHRRAANPKTFPAQLAHPFTQ